MTNKRVVIDTNILISAMLSPGGFPSQTWGKVISGECTLYYSHDIYEEYIDVLSRPKFPISEAEKEAVLSFISKYGVEIFPIKSNVAFTDEYDRIFYDTAKEVNAILVTGNIKHYPDESWVMTPADFVSI
jgi:putative PIN family toxin of toxin-antitoxin system